MSFSTKPNSPEGGPMFSAAARWRAMNAPVLGLFVRGQARPNVGAQDA